VKLDEIEKIVRYVVDGKWSMESGDRGAAPYGTCGASDGAVHGNLYCKT
jgi:hypothetical protein